MARCPIDNNTLTSMTKTSTWENFYCSECQNTFTGTGNNFFSISPMVGYKSVSGAYQTSFDGATNFEGDITLAQATNIDGEGAITIRTRDNTAAQTSRFSISDSLATAVGTWSNLTHTGVVITNASYINAANAADGNYFTIGARDSDTDAIVEVARVFGATDPYFAMGGSQEFKFYNSGALEVNAATDITLYAGTGGVTHVGATSDNRIDITNSTDTLAVILNNINQLSWTDGVFLLQKATSINTAGTLTVKTRNAAAAQTSRLAVSDSADYASFTLSNLSGFITPQSATASPVAVLTTSASANLKNSDDTEKSTVATDYTKIKEIKLNEALTGTVRMNFDLKTAGGGATATARIYKNAVALGTEQTDVTGGYATKTEDLGPFVAGDLLQIYAKTSDVAQAAYVQNFRLLYDVAIVTTALSVTNQDPA